MQWKGCSVNLTPVNSSHVAAVGYLEESRVLLVLYKDKTLAARLDVGPEQYAALLQADSKGKFLHALRGTSVSLSKAPGKEGEKTQETKITAAEGAQQKAPLDSLDEDAGKCCRKAMSKNVPPLQTEMFLCPDCGLQFRANMIGPVRHWSIVPLVVIHR